MKRRSFLAGCASLVTAPVLAQGLPQDQRFRFCMLDMGNGISNRPRGLTQLAFEIQKRCNIPIDSDYETAAIDDVLRVHSPFFVIAGRDALPQLTTEQADKLRNALRSGGFLLFDDQNSEEDSPFYRSAVAMMAAAFPELEPQIVPPDHSVYQSYYLLKEPRGRLNNLPYMEGWQQGIQTVSFFSHNDLLGALEADRLGNWKLNMEIGGGFRRELCFRLGINMTYYVLTINYKKDRAFPPVIERRRRQ